MVSLCLVLSGWEGAHSWPISKLSGVLRPTTYGSGMSVYVGDREGSLTVSFTVCLCVLYELLPVNDMLNNSTRLFKGALNNLSKG